MKALCFAFLSLSLITSALSADNKQTQLAQNYPALMSSPELSTLGSLVQLAGLETFFQGTGPFTLFAPSNSAFEKMDQKKLEELKKPENRDHLTDLINYHVIPGEYHSQSLKAKSYRTINGKEITIRITDSQIYVNDAKVTRADISGPNGVAYIIDAVLVP